MDSLQNRLELDSRLTELIRVRSWVDSLADRLRFPEEKRFAMHLCMEEALANVIMHGYRSEPGYPIIISAFLSAGTLSITVDDQAPPFSPTEFLPANGETKMRSLDSVAPGGNGIRLLKRFAGSMHYEKRSDGNRLTIAFPASFAESGV